MVNNESELLATLDDENLEDEAWLQFEMPFDFSRERLDKVLASLLPEHSRSRLQQWITDGAVLVNQEAAKVRQMVRAGDVIAVQPQASQEQQAFTPEALELDIIDAAEHYIIVNKPAGMVTHPGAGNWGGTLLNGLLYHFPELSYLPRAGIVHRLDKETSGVLMVARTEVGQTHLVRQLQARTVGREYLALAKGVVPKAGLIDAAIGRDRRVAVKMSTDAPIAPKIACTHFSAKAHGVWEKHAVSQVICRLETGRTHQIRVHLASIGHPLLGDSLYGGPQWAGAQRQMLHARCLTFIDPADEQERQYSASLPPDMQEVMASIAWSENVE